MGRHGLAVIQVWISNRLLHRRGGRREKIHVLSAVCGSFLNLLAPNLLSHAALLHKGAVSRFTSDTQVERARFLATTGTSL